MRLPALHGVCPGITGDLAAGLRGFSGASLARRIRGALVLPDPSIDLADIPDSALIGFNDVFGVDSRGRFYGSSLGREHDLLHLAINPHGPLHQLLLRPACALGPRIQVLVLF